MKKEYKELLANIKNQVLDVIAEMDRDNREEFLNKLDEWTYEKYEEALLEDELEMQNYED
mgnify:CR=1 FL=1